MKTYTPYKSLRKIPFTESKEMNLYLNCLGFTEESFEALIHPTKELNIDKLGQVNEVVDFLTSLLDEDKRVITIISDYDADGCTSNAILKLTLEKVGFTVNYYVPHRIYDGYGLSEKILEKIEKLYPDTQTIFTCDNGINAVDAIDKALNSKSYNVIVTDHHTIAEDSKKKLDKLMDMHDRFFVIHPSYTQNYPFPSISGAEVTYLFALKLLHSMNISDESLENYLLQLAAVSIVSDVMPVGSPDESMKNNINRHLLITGLESFKTNLDWHWEPLFEFLNINNETMDETTIGFYIAPAINATGRLDSAEIAINFLTAKTKDKCKLYASLMEHFNSRRKLMKQEYMDTIQVDDSKSAIIIQGSYHEGLIGILAGNLCEEYQRPSFVFAPCEIDGENGPLKAWKGSGRSIEGFNCFDILTNVQTKTNSIYTFGGHAGAAGLTVLDEHMEEFKNAIEDEVASMMSGDISQVTLNYLPLNISEVVNFSKMLTSFKPFGEGFKSPLVRFEGYVSNINFFYKSGHVKLGIYTKQGYLDVWLYSSLDKVLNDANFMEGFTKKSDNVAKRMETMSRREAEAGRWEKYSSDHSNCFEFYAYLDYGSFMNEVKTIINLEELNRLK